MAFLNPVNARGPTKGRLAGARSVPWPGMIGARAAPWTRWQVVRAASGHPVFKLPHGGPASARSPEHTAANFAYFEGLKRDRLAHLRFYLAKFGVDATDTAAVASWLPRYGQALLPTVRHIEALKSGDKAWAGDFATLNVVADLAIAEGEAAVALGQRWRWIADPAVIATSAALSDGNRQIDVVTEIAACCIDSKGERILALRETLSRTCVSA